MGKKIIFITSSPHAEGNTNTLVYHAAEAAENAGAEVEIVDINELEVKVPGCSACEGCHPDKLQCVIDDDLSDLIAELFRNDVVVFAAPIYFFGLPAQVKMVIDRFYSLMISESGVTFSPLKRVKFAVIATAGGDVDDSGFEVVELQMKYLEEYLETAEVKFLFRGGCNSHTDVANDPAAIAEAQNFGKQLAV